MRECPLGNYSHVADRYLIPVRLVRAGASGLTRHGLVQRNLHASILVACRSRIHCVYKRIVRKA